MVCFSYNLLVFVIFRYLVKIKMAVFAADGARTMALELKKRVLRVNIDLTALLQAVSGWTLNSTDDRLPLPFDIRTAIQQYRTVRLERLKLDELVELFLTAQYGDTLAINTTQEPATFDGGATFG